MVYLVLLRSLLYMKSREEKRNRMKQEKRKQKKIKLLRSKNRNPCRVCNKHKGDTSIFNNNLDIDIAEEIKNFSGVEIKESDNKSKYLCKHCLELLDGCIKFRKLCRKTNESLSISSTASITVKTEPLDIEVNSNVDNIKLDIGNGDDHFEDDHYSLPSPTFSEAEFKFYDCPTCQQPFPDLDKYNDHLLVCNGQPESKVVAPQEPQTKRRFLCDTCGKTISTLATLHIHMKIHEDIFPFHCDECPYRGRTIDLLRVHKRIHLTEKPYKCELCSKTATTASNLQRHMRNAHSTARPFKCDQCDRSYRLQRDVTKHIREAHSRLSSVNCPICDKTLSSMNALSKHRLKVHKIKGRNGRMPSYLQYETTHHTVEDGYRYIVGS